MRTYELMFLVDPRLSDEEVVELADHYKAEITAAGARIAGEESWGKRKLAYAINKLNEGRYHLLYVQTDGDNPLPQIEQRMRQNEQVLRYMSLRIDQEGADAMPMTEAETTSSEESEATT